MKEITVAADIANLPVVTEFIDEQLEAHACPMKAQLQLDVAVDELFSNIVQYAYPGGNGLITIRVEWTQHPQAVLLAFIDRGEPFNPLAADDPDITLSAEERDCGGLGIYLVKKTMDEVRYEYRDGRNILRIRKAW